MHTIRRNTFIICLLLTVFLTLSGCGKLNDYVNKKVTAESEKEIQNSDSYKKYVEYQSEGKVGEDGLYPMPTQEEVAGAANNENSIKITIASNTFLKCDYYTDEKAKTLIAGSEVFLNQGDSLFVADVNVNNEISNLYDFSCFRIWAYDQDGRRGKTPYGEVTNKNGLLLKIPQGFSGTGFSIEPIGKYTNRHITARAFYLDNGQEKNLPNGLWKVNNKVFSDSVDISPVDSYTIAYDYKTYKDDYYFVGSTPAYWYSKEGDNTVIFREVSSNEQETKFAVEMHPYITMQVTNKCINWASGIPIIGNQGKGIIQSIYKGQDAIEQDYAGKKSFEINKLKVNDKLSIRVGQEFKITGIDVNVGTAVPLGSNAENGYEYTIYVPDTRTGIGIEISERNSNAEGTFQGYNQANAVVEITRQNGTLLKIGDELPGDNEKVTMTIIPDDDYYINGFTDTNNFSYVKKNIKYSNLEKDILSILEAHQAIKFVSLNLVLSDEAGTYKYTLDGSKITEPVLQDARVGQKLKVEFTANEGYIITHSGFVEKAISSARTRSGELDSTTESVEISADMDGTTVNRETFGIIVEKEE